MRALSARAALRALRTTTSAAGPSVRVPLVRALCVRTPPVVKDAVVEPPIVAHTSHNPSAVIADEVPLSVDAAPVTSVLEAAPEPDTEAVAADVAVDDLSGAQALQQAVSDEDAEGAQALEEVLSGGTEDVAASNEGSSSRNQQHIRDFSTPAQLTQHLTNLVANKGTRSAMWCFRYALEQDGTPLLSVESIRLMLPVMARSGWFSTAQDCLIAANARNIQLSTNLYNCAMFAMMRTGSIKLIEETLARMSAGLARPNATSYNLLIAAHFYTGTVDDAFGVLQAMKAAEIYPTIATYQTLVSGCLRRRDHTRAYRTLVAIEQQGMTPSAMTVAQVLSAIVNDDNYDHVSHLLGKLEETLPLYSSDVDRISAKRSMFGDKHIKTSIHHRESVRGSPRLELSALNALLHSASRGARPDIAVELWNILSDSYPECPHTADHWYSLIGALAASGDFSAAFDAVGHMRAAGYVPDVRHLMVPLIRPLAADMQNIDDQYYRLVEQLENKDVVEPVAAAEVGTEENAKPVTEDLATAEAQENSAAATSDSASSDSLDAKLDEDIAKDLSASEDRAVLEVAKKSDANAEVADAPLSLTELLGGSNASKGAITSYELPWADHPRAPVDMCEFNCVIAACSLAWDLDRGFQTYDEACGRLGLSRDIDTLNALLEGCVQTRHMRGGERILEEARKEGFAHHPETLNLAVRLLLRGRKGDQALDALREAHVDGAYIPARTFQMLARHLARAGNMDGADECVQLAVEHGYRKMAIVPREDSFRGRGRYQGRKDDSGVDGDELDALVGEDDGTMGHGGVGAKSVGEAENENGSLNKAENNST